MLLHDWDKHLNIISTCWVIFGCLLIFQNQLFRKILSGKPWECQTVWIQIRPDILSGQIWVQTVCKGYQQTRVNNANLVKQFFLLHPQKPPNAHNLMFSLGVSCEKLNDVARRRRNSRSDWQQVCAVWFGVFLSVYYPLLGLFSWGDAQICFYPVNLKKS